VSDRFARFLAGVAVLAVAVIAGIVSFSHIEALALAHGYTPDTARLLPLSVDGLILAASLVLLVEARAHRPAPRLARAGLWISIGATLAANIAHGVAYGPVGAVANGWPAAAFIFASEILLGMIRRAGTTPAREAVAETVAGVPGMVDADVPVDVPVVAAVDVPSGTPSPARAATVKAVASKRAPRRASGRGAKSPERIFAKDVERGELPSLREVKRRARCGTDTARAHLEALQDAIAAQAGQEASADA